MTSNVWWCLNPTSADTGGLLNDDWETPNIPKLNLLTKTVPNPTLFYKTADQICFYNYVPPVPTPPTPLPSPEPTPIPKPTTPAPTTITPSVVPSTTTQTGGVKSSQKEIDMADAYVMLFGGIVGGLVVGLLVLAVIWCVWLRKTSKRRRYEQLMTT